MKSSNDYDPRIVDRLRGQFRDHAQIGLLLSKCCYFEVAMDAEGWSAKINLVDKGPFFEGEGNSQLEAIKSAMEKADD